MKLNAFVLIAINKMENGQNFFKVQGGKIQIYV